MGKQYGVGHAVGDVVLAAQGIAQGVNRGGAASGDGHAAVKRAQQQVVLRLHVGGIFVSPLNVAENQLRARRGVGVA